MSQLLGELEEQIMQIIWDAKRPLKPADVSRLLERELAYNTVMTIMKRLTDKELLKRSKRGNTYYYQPVKTKQNYVKSSVSKLFHGLVSNYGELAISQFVDTLKADPASLDKLTQYLDEITD